MRPYAVVTGLLLLLLPTAGCQPGGGQERPASIPAPAPVKSADEEIRTPSSPGLSTLAQEAARHPRDAKAAARYGSALVEAGDIGTGVRFLRQAVSVDPTLTPAWHNLGLAAERQGWLDLAAESYRQVVKAKPDHAGEWIKLGYCLIALGRYAEAEDAFRRASRLQPDSSEPIVALASSYYAAFRFEDALNSLHQATALNPRSTAAHVNTAAICLERGRPGEAEKAIRAALQIEPDVPRYHLILGQILARSPIADHREEGTAELNLALSQVHPGIPLTPAETATAQYFLGTLAQESGNPDAAISAWRQAIKLAPAQPEPWLALGHALVLRGGTDAIEGKRMLQEYARLQELRQQERELRQRVEGHPNDAGAHRRYGEIALQQGNLSRAVWEYREAVRLHPGDSTALGDLITALRLQGREDEAAEVRKRIGPGASAR